MIGIQALGCVMTICLAAVSTFLIMKLTFVAVKTDVDVATEAIGLDAVQCGEAAYNLSYEAKSADSRYV